ncbi:MAG: hypothetical protein AB1752_09110 [Candidatus Zixiibacteriota bacterium]
MTLTDQQLDSLVAEAAGENPPGFTLPADEVVHRYLLGTANATERKSIREALDLSKDFRRRLLELTEDIDRAAELAPSRGFARVLDGATESGSPRKEAGTMLSRWLPLAVAAGLVLYLLVIPTPPARLAQWAIVDPGLPGEELISLSTRSVALPPATGFANPRDAAVAAFRASLEFDKGEFRARPSAGPDSLLSLGHPSEIVLVGPDGMVLGAAKVAIPSGADRQLWSLSLPGRTLRKLVMNPQRGECFWDPQWGNQVGLVWTSSSDTVFQSGPVSYVEF